MPGMTGRFSVFKGKHWTPGSGDCGVTVSNYEDNVMHANVTLTPKGECAGGKLASCARWRLVDNTAWQHFDGAVTLPARSAAVVVPCK